jgi:hypothetical protein
MTVSTSNPARARADAVFRTVVTISPEAKMSAWEEYRAKQAAQLERMAQLRAARLTKGKR